MRSITEPFRLDISTIVLVYDEMTLQNKLEDKKYTLKTILCLVQIFIKRNSDNYKSLDSY